MSSLWTVVADGVGGGPAGEIASAALIRRMAAAPANTCPAPMPACTPPSTSLTATVTLLFAEQLETA